MEEQPPTEPPHRQPDPKSTRGPGRAKAAFTSAPAPDTGSTGEPPRTPRPRIRKTPPPVLFQPPTEPEQASPEPEQASPGGGSATGSTAPLPPPEQGSTRQVSPERGPAQADQATATPDAPAAGNSTPANQDPAPRPRKATAGKKAAKAAVKAAPAKRTTARKTAAVTKETTPATKTTAQKTAAKKATTVRKSTVSPAAAENVVETDAPGVADLPGRTVSERTPWSRPSAARDILDHPGYAPELLALAAVHTLGPEARAWAARIRTAYPTATADGLARLATRRYVRLAAAGGALSMSTGLLAPFAELAVVTWAQAGLVLHLAAAHDHDPTSPDRAADLLVLTRAHPDEESARAALAAAAAAVSGGADESAHRLAEAGWRLGTPILARTANWLALRLAVRRLPGAMTLVTALTNAATIERLAARATGHYRTAVRLREIAAGTAPQPYNQSNQLGGSSA